MLKSRKGFTGIDVSISIVAIIIFTSTILALMYNVKIENLKIKAQLLANIYLTETLENIGIAKYDDVTENNANLIPEMSNTFKIEINVSKISDEDANKTEDILKRVKVIASYPIGNKTYHQEVQRMKIKEQ